MWDIANNFLNTVAKQQGYERNTLSLVAELCSSGPTVQPDSSRNEVDELVTLGPDVYPPYADYDSLGSKHMEYRVIYTVSNGGKTTIPTTLYSFQLHPMPGCCGFAVNRWVRCNDDWSTDLQKSALKFRKALANRYGYTTLFVSKGMSGSASGELYDDFDILFEDTEKHQSLYGIAT